MRLLPKELAEREWVSFSAEGFSRPVTGVIYRGGNMLPGMPLGALGTGYIGLGTDGTLDYINTIFNGYVRLRGTCHRRDEVPALRLPFLGIAMGGKLQLSR